MGILLVLYLIVSFFVGIFEILGLREYENYCNSIPVGDLEFYDTSYDYGLVSFIFFPSFLVIFVWWLICFIINSIFYK